MYLGKFWQFLENNVFELFVIGSRSIRDHLRMLFDIEFEVGRKRSGYLGDQGKLIGRTGRGGQLIFPVRRVEENIQNLPLVSVRRRDHRGP